MKAVELEFRDPFTRFLQDNNMCIPLDQMVMFVILISLCLLFKKHQLGLLVTYIFVFSWGFVLNSEHFINIIGSNSSSLFVYGLLGLAVVTMVLIGFMTEKKQEKKKKRKAKLSKPELLFKMPDSN